MKGVVSAVVKVERMDEWAVMMAANWAALMVALMVALMATQIVMY